jgi:phosphoserine aminotransferase
LNFSPGPTSLAVEVEASIKALFDAERMCSMYLSHRSPEFLDILASVLQRCRIAMEIPEQYEILFMHGGGHGQFAAVPLNLCPKGDEKATYLVNGTWSKRALSDASKYCRPIVVSSENKDGTFTHNPSFEHLDPESKYVYLCSNETVNGIELHQLPKLSIKAPLVIDASSDFSTKPIDWVGSNVGVLYACASKNIGHPGLTLCVIRKDLLGTPSQLCPGVLCYTTNAREGNLWNTIATFNVEVVNIYMQWMIAQGGVQEMERRAIAKSAMLYDLIDKSEGFYSTPIADASIRSRMNIPFDVAGGNEETTRDFLIQGWERGIVGLRTLTPFGVGKYLRASLYNGVSVQQVEVLAAFMAGFLKTCRTKRLVA